MDDLFDTATERAVLSILLTDPTRYPDVAGRLTTWCFTGMHHAALYAAISDEYRRAAMYDVVSIMQSSDDVRELASSLMRDTAAAHSMLHAHVDRILGLAVKRRTTEMLSMAAHELSTNPTANPEDVMGSVVRRFEDVRAALDVDTDTTMTYDDWARLAEDEPAGWVIPGIIRARSRTMLLAPEGMGKSTLLRQIGVCVAAGIHPFFHERRIDPKRVLIIDVENDPRYAIGADNLVDRASPLGLLHTINRMVTDRDTSLCRVMSEPGGIDLRKPRDEQRVARAMRDHRPDITIIGPIYKLYRKRAGENDEDVAGEMQDVFDRLRTTHDTALLIEHHQPKERGRGKAATPFGSSLWLRWPDIGIALEHHRERADRFTIVRFRGHRYPVPGLPTAIDLDKRLPFAGYYRDGFPDEGLEF